MARADKWPCPKCRGKTTVVDSRGVHRRRECVECAHRFSTREVLIQNSRLQKIVDKSTKPAL